MAEVRCLLCDSLDKSNKSETAFISQDFVHRNCDGNSLKQMDFNVQNCGRHECSTIITVTSFLWMICCNPSKFYILMKFFSSTSVLIIPKIYIFFCNSMLNLNKTTNKVVILYVFMQTTQKYWNLFTVHVWNCVHSVQLH